MIKKPGNIKKVRNSGRLYSFLILIMSLSFFTACKGNSDLKQPYEQPNHVATPTPEVKDTEDEEPSKETTSTDITSKITETPGITEAPEQSFIIPEGETLSKRFKVPDGFTRVESGEESFAYYLQNLPLKPDGAKVKYHDGREKTRNVYLAVVDFTLGERDLQQCADAVMRLRAEYLYSKERYQEIRFNFVSGFNAEFSKWSEGKGISVDGNNVSWNSNSNNNGSYESFQKYLDIVYAYASTLSLEKELITKPFSELSIGDVFIKGGSPGHCVIVVDMAVNESTGEKIFMLAQSYMPAQDIQILKGDIEVSPWYSANIEDTLKTPEWTFDISQLKTWE